MVNVKVKRTYTVTMTDEQALALLDLTRCVAGPVTGTSREHTDAIKAGLLAAGVPPTLPTFAGSVRAYTRQEMSDVH